MIREYGPTDIVYIEQLGRTLHSNYRFKINEFTKCLVYVVDNYIVAFITYFIMYEKVEILDVAVKEEFKRKHIGSSLLNRVIEECNGMGCDTVSLEVRVTNEEAIAFYKSMGFREAAVRKSYYNGENALLMTKML